MDSIHDMTKDQKRVIAKEICDYGLSTLIFALERFPQESNFVKRIMILLKLLAYRERHSRRQLFLSLGTVDVILKTCGNFHDLLDPSIETLKINGMWVLVHLSSNGDIGDAVFRDECVEFVVGAMNSYQSNYYFQAAGSRYFKEISRFPDRKEYLIEKKVDKLLVDACHVFRSSDQSDREKFKYEKTAREAITRLCAP